MRVSSLLYRTKICTGLLILLLAVFALSIFKNISYPLLWNDEAETAMYARRILQYGYPKVHDGKNVLYLLELPSIGINKSIDAYVGNGWAQYYFAVIGEILAQRTQDIYTKTALLRIPFALIGFVGILLFAKSIAGFFEGYKNEMLIFTSFFIIFEILSVPLALHLREVRYYSLVIFLGAGIFYLYSQHGILKKPKSLFYSAILLLLLILLLNTFLPAYLAIIITMALSEGLKILQEWSWKDRASTIVPIILSSLFIVPVFIFFHTLDISREFHTAFNVTLSDRFFVGLTILNFFKNYELLNIILLARIAVLIVRCLHKKKNIETIQLNEYYTQIGVCNNVTVDRNLNISAWYYFSNFLTVFCFIYSFILIGGTRNGMVFERYFILMQPVLIIVLLLDLRILASLLNCTRITPLLRKKLKIAFFIILGSLLSINSKHKIDSLTKHFYEQFHRYEGPLDYAIYFIRSKYRETDKLIIATNYEECSYMYYLDSQTIVGFVHNNLIEDIKLTPDIIIPRKQAANQNTNLYKVFLQKADYQSIVFPISDSLYNNIPEINSHAFKTKMADKESDGLVIYYRQ